MILLVDDEAENIASLAAVLEREGWACLRASSAAEGLALLRQHNEIKLLITDMKMPGMSGLELLQAARQARPDVQRLLVTAFGTMEAAVAAMKAGACDVLAKPLKAKAIREKVAELLARAADLTMATSEPAGQLSPAYAQVTEMIRRAAASQASVLFTGESGSGKSYLAQLLHQWSERRNGPYKPLNCAAIPAELLESELFGHEKGAFTGASQRSEGKIFAANGGTLLLDEIGDLSSELQAKLLQFIQEKKFHRLGSNKEVVADVRIIAATNRPLSELVADGRFREDLLWRLKVVEIHVPPLRERKQDLLWLVPALLDNLTEKNQLPRVRLTHTAFARIWAHDWPGNIRELENVLESLIVMAPQEELREGFLSGKGLPAHLREAAPQEVPFVADLATIERQAIQQAMILTGGNRRLTSSLLGISERTLYRVLAD